MNGARIDTWFFLSTIYWISAAFFWIAGFLQLWIVKPGPNSKLVYVPRWMYYFLLTLRHKSIPKYVMLSQSVYLQLMGITMILYRIILGQNIIKNHTLSAFIGFIGSMGLGFAVAQWLEKKHPYQWVDNS